MSRIIAKSSSILLLLTLWGCAERNAPSTGLETSESNPIAKTDIAMGMDTITVPEDCSPASDASTIAVGLLPYVPGPDPELFDCTAPEPVAGPRNWVDLSCWLAPSCDKKMIVGHRGTGGNLGTIAPENSLQAIRAAIVMGLDAVEIDVRHTLDEKLVVLHDGSVDRTTDFEGEASELNFAELTTMPLLPPKHPMLKGDFACSRIPSLEAAFDLTRDRIAVILDTKTHRIDLVAKAITDAELQDQVFISVSDANKAVEARQISPNLRVQIRPDNLQELEEMLLLFEHPPEIVEIPPEQVILIQEDIKAIKAKVFTDVWVQDAMAIAGDEGAGYLKLFDDGAHILQTEYPTQVLKALNRWSFDAQCP